MADLAELRRAARRILDAAIAAGDAGRLTRQALAREGSRLRVGGRAFDLARVRRVVVVGAGKASGTMAEAAEAVLDGVPLEGLVAVKERRDPGPRRVRVVESGHPIPDARGEAAGEEILRLARDAGPDDLVLCLISGGGSALTPSPVPGVTLAEKQVVTRLLLECGATINELNAVRKHLSRLKGGQLARAAHPAPVVALLLSDVIGDPLDVIASGPTAPDPTTYADALAVLDRFGLRARVPATVRAHLEAGARGEVAGHAEAGRPGSGRRHERGDREQRARRQCRGRGGATARAHALPPDAAPPGRGARGGAGVRGRPRRDRAERLARRAAGVPDRRQARRP